MQYTLEPLVYVGPAEGKPKGEWKLKSARELLALKICDMACGSGAFLVQVCRYLAARLLEAWDAAKQANPNTHGITPEGEPSTGQANETLIPDDPDERTTYAMRIIAQRCLYGVDKNPLAAEMAKLSLWLLTLAKDKPFEFLDHNIRCGDSLVGIHDLAQLRHFSLKPDADDAVLFKGPLDEAVDEAISLRLKLEGLPTNTVDDVVRQEKLLTEANDKIARLRCAADLLVSAEFWGERAKDKLEKVRHAAVVSGHYVDNGPTEEFEQVATKERRGQPMFHWPLEFPEVIVKRGGFDAFVGNPPFMGGKKLSGEFGKQYREHTASDVGRSAKGHGDLCAFFLVRASDLQTSGGYSGFITTNTISEGDTRELGLDQLCESKCSIIRATARQKWPGSASVEISMVWLSNNSWLGQPELDNKPVTVITPFLTERGEIFGTPFRLAANHHRGFIGSYVLGVGFIIEETEAVSLMSLNPKNRNVLFPYANGDDINRSLSHISNKWIINFFDWPLNHDSAPEGYAGPVASDYPECLDIVVSRVKPERDKLGLKADSSAKGYARLWWQYGRKGHDLRAATANMDHVLARSCVSSINAIARVPTGIVYSHAAVIFAFSTHGYFALLQSSIHASWLTSYASSMRTDVRYTPSDCFETFPFPTEVDSCQSAGVAYESFRKDIMDRKQKGMRPIYNLFDDSDETLTDIQKFRGLHVEMDQAVAAAYGWTDIDLGHGFHETKQGVRFTISEPARREVLQRLLKLNHERYAEEVKQGLHDKKKPKTTARKKKLSSTTEEPTLF